MTPDARKGDWVLVHAGFALTQIDEAEAKETWETLQMALGNGLPPDDSPKELLFPLGLSVHHSQHYYL